MLPTWINSTGIEEREIDTALYILASLKEVNQARLEVAKEAERRGRDIL